MSASVDPRDSRSDIQAGGAMSAALAAEQILPLGLDPDLDIGHNLPGDHPAWAKDVVSLSQRFRATFARIKPLAVRVLTFWDHHIRSIMVCGRRMAVDASGCYKID